jgi:hypothetical protein
MSEWKYGDAVDLLGLTHEEGEAIDLRIANERITALEAENQRLKELLEEAAEAFESASDGGGVDFYGYAKGIREEL